MNNLWLKNLLKKLWLNESAISTFLGGLVVAVVAVLIYNYFSQINQGTAEVTPVATPSLELVEEDGKMIPEGLPLTHKVAPGEDLWNISVKYYQNGFNWVDIAKENNIANPDQIETGQELTIPRVGVKVVAQLEAKPAITADEYLVQKGDYLWKIAVNAYGDGYAWTKIYEANKELITNPSVIEPGMLIKLPR